MPPVSNNDIDDTNEEGVWHDTFTGKPLTYTPPWMGSEPNGGSRENCAGNTCTIFCTRNFSMGQHLLKPCWTLSD